MGFSSKNTGVGCHFLLQGIVLKKLKGKVTQSCPTLYNPTDHTVRGVLQSSMLEWAAFPFSRASSQPRDRTCVSCFAGRFFRTVPPGKPRRDVDRPPLGCPPTPVTGSSTDGEGAGWPSQSRAGSSGVHRKFSFTCHTKSESGLRWGNESGSNGIYSQAGTQAPSGGVWALSSNLLTKNWGWSGSPLGCPPEGYSGHSFSSHHCYVHISGDAVKNLQKVLESYSGNSTIFTRINNEPLTQLTKSLKSFLFFKYVYIHICVSFS